MPREALRLGSQSAADQLQPRKTVVRGLRGPPALLKGHLENHSFRSLGVSRHSSLVGASLLPCSAQRPHTPGVPAARVAPARLSRSLPMPPLTFLTFAPAATTISMPPTLPSASSASKLTLQAAPALARSLGALTLGQHLGQPCLPGSSAPRCCSWHVLLTAPSPHALEQTALPLGLFNTDSEPATCRLQDEDNWSLPTRMPSLKGETCS